MASHSMQTLPETAFKIAAVLAYQMTCLQTFGVTMATINLESHERLFSQ